VIFVAEKSNLTAAVNPHHKVLRNREGALECHPGQAAW